MVIRNIWLALPIDLTAFVITFNRSLRFERNRPIGERIALEDTERSGLFALYDYSHFFYTLIRSELERQTLIYVYLGDLVKGGMVYTD